MKPSKDFRFIYLHDKDNFPSTCIAMHIDRNTNTVVYGVSTVHPSDKNEFYEREHARALAVGRLMLDHKSIRYPMRTYNSLADITWSLLANMRQDKTLPSRTRKAIKRWLTDPENKTINSVIAGDYPSGILAIPSIGA